VPKFRGSLYRVKRDSVSGQRANNFLDRGLHASMAVPYLHRSPRITGNPFG
jgi:hypothetical protein